MLFRFVFALYGVVLATIAFWLLCADLESPSTAAFQLNQEASLPSANARDAALSAARLASLRGDLWTEAALSYANLIWADPSTIAAPILDQAKAAAARAMRLDPINPSVWLMLASLGEHFGWQNPNPGESLKMSYYTGPHEATLIPLRLAAAVQLDTSYDPELGFLFEREVENVLIYHPEMKPALLSAYRQATAHYRHSLEEITKRFDPALSDSLSLTGQ